MTGTVGDRTHLSIGEVLSLLREEFADITISKIRFLESQGLVDPERTPSGYRKFYEDDVATRMSAVLSLIEPGIMIFMGIFVAFVLVALYLPIFSLADTIR